jgi:hypothetical protein
VHLLLRRLGERHACPTCGAAAFTHVRRDDWIDQLYATTCTSIHGACKL